jgi:hypothetical protein
MTMQFRTSIWLVLALVCGPTATAELCVIITNEFFDKHRQKVAIEAVPTTIMPAGGGPFTPQTDDLFRVSLLNSLARALSDREVIRTAQWIESKVKDTKQFVVAIRRKTDEFAEVWVNGGHLNYRFFRNHNNTRVYAEEGAIDPSSFTTWHLGLLSQARGFDFGESLLKEFASSSPTQSLAQSVLKNLDSSQLLTRWGYFELQGFRKLMIDLASRLKGNDTYANSNRLLRVSWAENKFLKITDAIENLSFLIPKDEIFGAQARMSVYVQVRGAGDGLHRVIKINAAGPLELEAAGFDPTMGAPLYRPVAKMPTR